MIKGYLLTGALVLCGFFAFAQLDADFTANNTQGCGSLQVNFTDQSTPAANTTIVSWDWDLGGVQSSSQNPGRIFGSPGKYTICLTVTDSEGATATECKTELITVFKLPEPNFTLDPDRGCVPLDVTFTDSTVVGDAPINQYIWGLGGSAGVIVDDGTGGPITSSYNTPDMYTVSLTVRDENGCSNVVTKTDLINVSPNPQVAASADATTQCEAPFTVQFSNDSPELNGFSFEWDFGNGITFNGTNPPPVTYTESGQYTITVIGTNDGTGCQTTLTLSNYIIVGKPVEFNMNKTSGCEDLTVNFGDISTDPADSIRWDFGDGNFSSLVNPNHTYTDPGCYTVSLTRFISGCTSSKTADTCIQVFQTPTAIYTAGNNRGCSTPHLVNFSNQSIGATSYFWDFGDGNTSTSTNPTHTYTSFGQFPVSLTVTNDDGCSHTATLETIRIEEVTAAIGGGRFFDCTPLTVNLTDASTSLFPIISWRWEITNLATSPPITITSMDRNPSLILTDTGRYDIRLTVTNSRGCSDTKVFSNRIGVGMPPVISFDANPRTSCVNSSIAFTNQTSDFADEYLWTFGDGGTSDEENPDYLYKDTGYFNVTLMAAHLGCVNELKIDSFIHITPPLARFTTNRDCADPYTVSVNDLSIGADRIHWDFGDETVENDTFNISEPSYTYIQTGSYTITQIVENYQTGCTDTARLLVRITDPKAVFSIDTFAGCVPLTLEVSNDSEFAASYAWSGPGASFSNSGATPNITYNSIGKYTDIQLIITDINNCQDTFLITDTITVNGVVTEFAADPVVGCVPLDVAFTDQSYSVYGTATSWSWNLGEAGATPTEVNPNYTYVVDGTKNVSLTVTDDWGCSSTITKNNLIDAGLPIANFIADTLSCTTRRIQFNNQSTGRSLSYLWDFGDGNTSTAGNPAHTYTTEGTYTVCLTVTNPHGCDSTLCKTDYVSIANPIAAFTADQTFADCPPLITNFQNTSQNANTFFWDFGDEGGTSDLENPPHVYTIPGVYSVTLIASGTPFCHDTLTYTDYITLEGPRGSFTFDIDSACVPATVTFIGESDDYYNYIWDFGNGVLDSTNNVIADTISFEYDQVGKFVPKLILVNADDCHRALESPDTIRIEDLVPDFISFDTIICGGNEATFLNTSQSTHPISFVEWTFPGGNPATSNSFEPSVSFPGAGEYDVQLVLDNGFCRDTILKPSFIKVGAIPSAAFSASDTEGCVPQSISFTSEATIDAPEEIVAWDWTFGNGDSSKLTNPSFTFTETGDYLIRQRVTSGIGCMDSTDMTISIHPFPEVDLGEEQSICRTDDARLQATIISGNVTDFYWLADTTLSCTNCLDPIASPMDTTTYYFVSINDMGCSDTSFIRVLVKPYFPPVINLTADTTICQNETVRIIATSDDVWDVFNWDESRLGLSCYNECENPIASPDQSTTYVLTVTSQHGCVSTDSVRVDVVDPNREFVSPDRTICEGDTAHLSINYGNNPEWLNPEGLSCSNCPDPIVDILDTKTFYVEVVTEFGCKIQDSVTIKIMHPEDIDAGEDAIICLGETADLNGSILEGSVQWTPAAGIANPTAASTTAAAQTSGYRLMTVTNGDCILSDSMYITVETEVMLDAIDTIICEGESVVIEVTGNADDVFWIPSRGVSDVASFSPVLTPNKPTVYNVIGTKGTCIPDTLPIFVDVIPAPETDLEPRYRIFPGQVVKLDTGADGTEPFDYSWSPPDGLSCRTCASPAAQPEVTTTYQLVVLDMETGCVDTATTIVEILTACPKDIVTMPNIFTPNNDGNNDVLKLFHLDGLETIKSFKIFDRWGELVYGTEDIFGGWDGTIKGQPAHNGVYVYLIEAECPIDGRPIYYSGDVTLIRN